MSRSKAVPVNPTTLQRRQEVASRLDGTTNLHIVRYVQVSDDFDALSKILFAQESSSPKKDPDSVTERIQKRVRWLTGARGIFTYRTGGEKAFPEFSHDKRSGETYYFSNKDLHCAGFIWYPSGKFLPVLPEEIEVLRTLDDGETYLVGQALNDNAFPRSIRLC